MGATVWLRKYGLGLTPEHVLVLEPADIAFGHVFHLDYPLAHTYVTPRKPHQCRWSVAHKSNTVNRGSLAHELRSLSVERQLCERSGVAAISVDILRHLKFVLIPLVKNGFQVQND